MINNMQGKTLKIIALSLLVIIIAVFTSDMLRLTYSIHNHFFFMATISVVLNILIAIFTATLLLSSTTFIFIFSLFSAASYMCLDLFKTGVTQDIVGLVFRESSNIGNFLNSYPIHKYIIIFLFLFLILLFIKQKSKLKLNFKIQLVSLIISLILSYGLGKVVGIQQIQVQPFNIVGTSLYYMVRGPIHKNRNAVQEVPTGSDKNHIILIVDESIAYSHLAIDGYGRNTTPYLASHRNLFTSLGPSLSSANCSSSSNIIFTSAVQKQSIFPDIRGRITLSKANIFAYAKKAGYKTQYISGQRDGKDLQNYMTSFDLKTIDKVQGFRDKKNLADSDFKLIKPIVDFVKNNNKTFTYVVKFGNHFPWGEGHYDKKVVPFPSHENLPLLQKNKAMLVDNYDNGVFYSVDLFLSKLIPSLDKQALVVYTSDHGQNILNSKKTRATHCSVSNVPIEQGIVPILIFNDKNVFLSHKKGYYSHFDIINSILFDMGYKVNIDDTFYSKNPNKTNSFMNMSIFNRHMVNVNVPDGYGATN